MMRQAHKIRLIDFGGEPPFEALDEIRGVGQVCVKYGAVEFHSIVAKFHVLWLWHLTAVALLPLRAEYGFDFGFQILLQRHGTPR